MVQEMGSDDWVAGRASTPDPSTPPRPDELSTLGLVTPQTPPAKPSPHKLIRAGAVLLIGFSVLLAIGLCGLLVKNDHSLPNAQLVVDGVFVIAFFLGGLHFFRRGWQQGHDVLNVLSVLPIAVFAVIVVLNLVVRHPSATPVRPQTDAYGYTAAEKQSLVSGCGGGATCTCLMDAVVRNVPHDQLIEESLTYARTGSFSPSFKSTLQQVFVASSC
jgi:hypothetical protein